MPADDPQFATAEPSAAAPSHEAMQQAAEWFALLRSGAATAQQHDDWRIWLESRGEHHQAWQYVEIISRRFISLQSAPDPRPVVTSLQALSGKSRQRRQWLSGIAVLAGATLLGWPILTRTPLAGAVMAWTADYHTGVGEVREITLADDTRVWLNTASAFNVDYQAALRRLQSVVGEMLIETAADAARPFVVDTGQGQLRALGTRFTVRLADSETFLAVYAGAVEIRTADTGRVRIIEAGQQTRFNRAVIALPEAAGHGREAWTRGVLLAEDIPLRELIAELNRYCPSHLGVAPEVAELRVLGGYPLHDSDKVLAMLEAVLPIRVRRTLPWWVSIEAKE